MRIISTFFAILIFYVGHSQEWVKKMEDPSVNFYDVQRSFNAAWEGRAYEKGNGYKQFKRWEWFMEQRVYPSGARPSKNGTWNAWQQGLVRPKGIDAKSAANWTPLGPITWNTSSYNPGNGRINVIAEDPNDLNTIYVGTPSGGIWKSVNSGGTWAPLFDDMPTLGVSGIAIDPTNSNTVFISTGDGDGADTYSIGVLRSSDGGTTWNTTGLTWNTGQSHRTYKLLMHPNDPSTLFCASNVGLWKTTDAGTTWTLVLAGRIRDVEFKTNNTSVVYASTDEFFKSTDGGDTFTLITQGLPVASDVNRMSVGVSENDPNMVYVLCGREDDSSFEGLYRSVDSGNTFTQRSNSPNIFGYSDTGSDNSGQSWYDMALAVDPTNAQTVYIGGVNVWKSTNGGSTWSIKSHWIWPSSQGYTHADIHTLDIHGNRLYCGSDGGIFRSTNGTNAWTDLSSGLNIMQFYRLGSSATNPSLIIAGAQDNGSNLFTGIWTHVLGADGMEAAIDPTDPNTMYAATQNGGLTRSDNGGASFFGITSGINDDGGWVTPYVIDPSNSNRLYAGFQELWKSNDQGDTWVPVSSTGTSEKVRVLAVAPSNPSYLYYGNNDWIQYSSNGGNSWLIISNALPNLSPTSIAVHPLDPTTVYVSYSGYQSGQKVFVTTDAGATWANISGSLPNLPVNSVVFENGSQGGIYAGTDLGIYYTDSTLSTWQPFSDGLPNVIISELEINQAAGKLRAATYGRGMWESDLFTHSTQPPVASFTYSNSNICAGDTIQFFDSSVDAIPLWSWQFPGGTPSSSTDPSPTVVYPTSGSYTVTLTMSNSHGIDVATSIVAVNILPNQLDLEIVVDDYPNETTWSFFDVSGNEVASGGPYTGATSGDLFEHAICLADGCYTFLLYDSYGDGICCGFGNGSYQLSNSQQGIIASGGQFTFQDSTMFCTFSVGVTELDPNEMLVDPNPTNGTVHIKLPYSEPGALQLMDATGRVMQQYRTSQNSFTIDLSEHSSGVYYVVWKNEKQRYQVPLLLRK